MIKIFVRPEGHHFVALCERLHLIVEGQTEEEAIEKAKALAVRALSRVGRDEPLRVSFLIRTKALKFETVTLDLGNRAF